MHYGDAKEAIEIVQKWSDSHPIPKPKTYAEDFFEKFPNAPKCCGTPSACRDCIYGSGKVCGPGLCKDCWNEPMPVEET